MSPWLGFDLYAPLAALGEVAVGERRTGFDRPARSAVIGLLAAALGIERRDEAGLLALDAGYGIATRTLRSGTLLEDYHTAQMPSAKRGRSWATRREELAEPELNTVLSRREYRTHAGWRVLLWAREGAPVPLDGLQEALRRPRFALYLGRRACPLGLPPDPWLDAASSTLPEAFARRETTLAERRKLLRDPSREERKQAARTDDWSLINGRRSLARLLDDLEPAAAIHVDADGEARLGRGWRVARAGHRRDLLRSRRRWQFGLREELVGEPEPPREAAP